MRTVFAILLCVLAMSRYPVSALRQIAAWTAQSATPGLPSTTQTPPRPSPSGSVQRLYRLLLRTAALRCIQNALGGTNEVAALSSVRFVGKTKPTATTRPRPYATRIEIGTVFPDRFKLQTAQTDGLQSLRSMVGFNGEVLLANPRVPDVAVPKVMPKARQEFVRQMLMRLPGSWPASAFPSAWCATPVRSDSPLTRSVRPLSPLFWRTSTRACLSHFSTTKVSMAEGSDTVPRRSLEYRRFGGIRFPTLLRQAKNGAAWEDEYDVNVEVNASFDDRYFRQ